MAVRTALNPLESGWLDYRIMGKLPHKDTDEVRALRLAYYAGASHLLAFVVELGDLGPRLRDLLDPQLVDLLVAELDAFIQERTSELAP